MAKSTQHIIQCYKSPTGRQKTPPMQDQFICKDRAEANRRAQKYWETGRYIGVDAFSMSGDSDLGEYGEPKFILRLGEVPETDY